MSKVMSESDKVCMSGYTLTYFEGERGRAEAIRMMMSLAGQPYEEVGISISDWFSGYKQKTPLGYMPIITTDDGELSNTVAICNFIATKLGFQPESEWDRAQSESVMITANDLVDTLGYQLYMYIVWKLVQPVPDDIEERKAKVKEEIIKKYSFFSKVAKPGAKFLFGNKITVADIYLYAVTDFACVLYPETRTISAWFEHWITNMDADPQFANYLENRPPLGEIGT